jgi:hypothetical protein
VDEALKKNTDNNDPFIVCLGTPKEFTSSVVVCNRKVITSETGKLIFSSILSLLAVHFAYNLSYNPLIRQVMEFFQEKVLGSVLPSTQKMSTGYCNLFRAVNCLEQALEMLKILQKIVKMQPRNFVTIKTKHVLIASKFALMTTCCCRK